MLIILPYSYELICIAKEVAQSDPVNNIHPMLEENPRFWVEYWLALLHKHYDSLWKIKPYNLKGACFVNQIVWSNPFTNILAIHAVYYFRSKLTILKRRYRSVTIHFQQHLPAPKFALPLKTCGELCDTLQHRIIPSWNQSWNGLLSCPTIKC